MKVHGQHAVTNPKSDAVLLAGIGSKLFFIQIDFRDKTLFFKKTQGMNSVIFVNQDVQIYRLPQISSTIYPFGKNRTFKRNSRYLMPFQKI